MRKILIFIVFFGLFLPQTTRADEEIKFQAQDRVLIVAPHPDDETLGVAGVIQSALAAGADVKVLFMTHGEFNEIAAIFYQKRPLITQKDFLKNGQIRKNEAIAALTCLGVKPENVIFLGYPDQGTFQMWQTYWNAPKAYRSLLMRMDKVLYPDEFSSGKEFRAENLCGDMKKVLLDFHPTQIFVTTPFDQNSDHRAAFLFLNAACLELANQLVPFPVIRLYIIHTPGWPNEKKFDPGAPVEPPQRLEGVPGLRWSYLTLTESEIEKKKDALKLYKSQMAYKRSFMLGFVRGKELFCQMEAPVLSDVMPGASSGERAERPKGVEYALTPDFFYAEIPVGRAPDEMGMLTLDVFSYRSPVSFSLMPKLRLRLSGSRLFARNGWRRLSDPQLSYSSTKKRIRIRIPTRLLGRPDYLFVSTRMSKEERPLEFGSWTIFRTTAKS